MPNRLRADTNVSALLRFFIPPQNLQINLFNPKIPQKTPIYPPPTLKYQNQNPLPPLSKMPFIHTVKHKLNPYTLNNLFNKYIKNIRYNQLNIVNHTTSPINY